MMMQMHHMGEELNPVEFTVVVAREAGKDKGRI